MKRQMKMDARELDIALLKGLSETPGLPGREMPVAEAIRAALPRGGWEVSTDAPGNLVAHLPGDGPRVLLVAHMDEVGLIVRRITGGGFLLVERMGGMGVRSLPGSRLTLWTDSGPLPAIAGVLPHHLDTKGPPDLADVYVDIGAASRADAERMGARVGDVLTWSSALERHGYSLVCGKALDDRLGCFVLVTLAHGLDAHPPACDLYLAFVVQEETMLMGGLPVAQRLSPDVAIGVDGTLAFDTPDLEGKQSDIRVGAGPALKLFDAIRGGGASFVPGRRLARLVLEVAAREGIPLQREVITGLSTAITPLTYAGDGLEAAALSLPIRYHHSPVETADLSDAAHMVGLLLALLTGPLT